MGGLGGEAAALALRSRRGPLAPEDEAAGNLQGHILLEKSTEVLVLWPVPSSLGLGTEQDGIPHAPGSHPWRG